MIEKVFTLSTAHMPNSNPVFGLHTITPTDIPRVTEHEYGYIIHLYEEMLNYCTPWFKPIARKALGENCVMVNFDRDADVDISFPTYDW